MNTTGPFGAQKIHPNIHCNGGDHCNRRLKRVVGMTHLYRPWDWNSSCYSSRLLGSYMVQMFAIVPYMDGLL